VTDILEILENGRIDWSDEHQTTTTIVTKNERLAIAEIKKLRARIAELEVALNGWQQWWGLPWQDRRPDIAERCYRAASAALKEEKKNAKCDP